MGQDKNEVTKDKEEIYPELKLKPKYLIDDYVELLLKAMKRDLKSKNRI